MRLGVDPIACESHGLCAELLPELIGLDDWGHPVLADCDVPLDLEWLATRAVRACPTLALRIEESVATREAANTRDVRATETAGTTARRGPRRRLDGTTRPRS
jgi:ferredoxin